VNPLMLQAELAQARKQMGALMMEREQYVRLTICLANMIRKNSTAKIVDGHVAVERSAYEEVPRKWRVALATKAVRAADADPETPAEEVVVVEVLAHTPVNGSGLLAPSAPRLVVPG
jgi:hypothetical protein